MESVDENMFRGMWYSIRMQMPANVVKRDMKMKEAEYRTVTRACIEERVYMVSVMIWFGVGQV